MLPQTYLHVAAPSAVQIPFTSGENTFFASGYVRSSGKYQTDTSQILIVKSPYARTHHDPQTCLQGLGETIVAEDMFSPHADMYIRRLTLRSGDFVYYWFTDGSRVVFDYGERVWEGLRGCIGCELGIDTEKLESMIIRSLYKVVDTYIAWGRELSRIELKYAISDCRISACTRVYTKSKTMTCMREHFGKNTLKLFCGVSELGSTIYHTIEFPPI
jgi:hypothetical protein